MRDGNISFLCFLEMFFSVVSLPMRDGNPIFERTIADNIALLAYL